MTKKNVIIEKDNFRARLNLAPSLTITPPVGDKLKFDKSIFDKLQVLYRFVSDDMSRPWSQTILIKGHWAYATNNIVCIRTKTSMKDCVLPGVIVLLLKKISLPIKKIITDTGKLSVIFKGGAWISCLLPIDSWPGEFTEIFTKVKTPTEIDGDLMRCFKTAADFCHDDALTVEEGVIKTSTTEVRTKTNINCKVTCENMLRAIEVFTHIDFSAPVMPMSCEDFQGMMVQIA